MPLLLLVILLVLLFVLLLLLSVLTRTTTTSWIIIRPSAASSAVLVVSYLAIFRSGWECAHAFAPQQRQQLQRQRQQLQLQQRQQLQQLQPKQGPLMARRGSEGKEDNAKKSPFINSQWTIQLNFGLEPGSFMPRRFPDWAASGARLGVPVELCFTDIPSVATTTTTTTTTAEEEEEEEDNGASNRGVYRVQVSPMLNSTFVSDRGEEIVTFAGGGYTMERSMMIIPNNNVLLDEDDNDNDDNDDDNVDDNVDDANITPPTITKRKPRFLLRFWIDCTSGAKRRDVELEPSTRIFGTIPIWDDPDQIIAPLEQELMLIDAKMKMKKKQQDDMDANPPQKADAGPNSFFGAIDWFFFGGPSQKKNEDDESSLSYRKEQLERLLPLKGSVTAGNGVTPAPKGSLVMSYQEEEEEAETEEGYDAYSFGSSRSRSSGGSSGGGSGGSVKKQTYLIIGSFAMRPVPSNRPTNQPTDPNDF